MHRLEKPEGFPGQRIIRLPRSVVARARHHPLLAEICPTDVGYFPCATGHLRDRTEGIDQTIFIYCIEGAGWCEIKGRRHSVKTGDMLVVPAGSPHVYGADPEHPWSIHWFHAKGELIKVFLDALGTTVDQPTIQVGNNPQLLVLFEEALEAVEHGYTPSQLSYAAGILTHLLAATVLHYRDHPHEQPGAHQRIAQTIAYMKQHLHQPLALDTLASVAGFGKSQYAALFKQQTGYAPIDYFIRLKMHRACQLLDTTSSSVKAIALSVGYDDPLYFSRAFRQVNGTSPQAYRQIRKG